MKFSDINSPIVLLINPESSTGTKIFITRDRDSEDFESNDFESEWSESVDSRDESEAYEATEQFLEEEQNLALKKISKQSKKLAKNTKKAIQKMQDLNLEILELYNRIENI